MRGYKKVKEQDVEGGSCYRCAVVAPSPAAVLSPGERLPRSFDWRQPDRPYQGALSPSWLTPVRNQHTPAYSARINNTIVTMITISIKLCST